jgi:hypothetical protein
MKLIHNETTGKYYFREINFIVADNNYWME